MKRLFLPLFGEAHSIEKEIIQELTQNQSLRSLETLSFPGEKLRPKLVTLILELLETNTSLVNLRTIEGLKMDESELFRYEDLQRLSQFEHLKNFNFSCITHLFENELNSAVRFTCSDED